MEKEEITFDRTGNALLVTNQIEEFNKLSDEGKMQALYEADLHSHSTEILGTRADQNS